MWIGGFPIALFVVFSCVSNQELHPKDITNKLEQGYGGHASRFPSYKYYVLVPPDFH